MSSQSNGTAMNYPNSGAQSTLGNLNTSPTAGGNGMNAMLPQQAGAQIGGIAGPQTATVNGQPMTMIQMLQQAGRSSSGY